MRLTGSAGSSQELTHIAATPDYAALEQSWLSADAVRLMAAHRIVMCAGSAQYQRVSIHATQARLVTRPPAPLGTLRRRCCAAAATRRAGPLPALAANVSAFSPSASAGAISLPLVATQGRRTCRRRGPQPPPSLPTTLRLGDRWFNIRASGLRAYYTVAYGDGQSTLHDRGGVVTLKLSHRSSPGASSLSQRPPTAAATYQQQQQPVAIASSIRNGN
jgi:hypothetical protein